MEKRSVKAQTKERQISVEAEKTPFQKMLEERAKRLEQVSALSTAKLCYLKYCCVIFTEEIMYSKFFLTYISILCFRLKNDKMVAVVVTPVKTVGIAARNQ